MSIDDMFGLFLVLFGIVMLVLWSYSLRKEK